METRIKGLSSDRSYKNVHSAQSCLELTKAILEGTHQRVWSSNSMLIRERANKKYAHQVKSELLNTLSCFFYYSCSTKLDNFSDNYAIIFSKSRWRKQSESCNFTRFPIIG